MNSYDLEAIRAIRRYQEKYDTYPACVEATAEYCSAMTQMYFAFPGGDTTPVRVPVVPVGTGDIAYRKLVVRETDIGQQQAECAAHEAFHRLGARLARAGCSILGEKSSEGLQTYNPHLFYFQIEAWIFGEEAVLEEMTAEKNNQSDEEQCL